MCQHFDEEEKDLMPLFRKHVSPKEYAKYITGPIDRTMTSLDIGNFFDNLNQNGPDDVKDFKKQEKIPFFIMWWLNWETRKYVRNIKAPFEKAVKEAEAAGGSVGSTAAA